ncbi:unnamed protein product, partial [Iphiclides podalirius]
MGTERKIRLTQPIVNKPPSLAAEVNTGRRQRRARSQGQCHPGLARKFSEAGKIFGPRPDTPETIKASSDADTETCTTLCQLPPHARNRFATVTLSINRPEQNLLPILADESFAH